MLVITVERTHRAKATVQHFCTTFQLSTVASQRATVASFSSAPSALLLGRLCLVSRENMCIFTRAILVQPGSFEVPRYVHVRSLTNAVLIAYRCSPTISQSASLPRSRPGDHWERVHRYLGATACLPITVPLVAGHEILHILYTQKSPRELACVHTLDILQAKSQNIAVASLQMTAVRAYSLLRCPCTISH